MSRIFAKAGLAIIAAMVPLLAHGSACNDVIVARIKMTAGSTCWAYHGDATSFVGAFGAGQRVLARMRGLASEYDPKTGGTKTYMANRSPDVSGPGGFYTGADIDVPTLSFVAPRAGVYRFSFSPCAMWGAPGSVEICAR